MSVKRTPVAKILVLFSWSIPFLAAAAVLGWFYLKSAMFPLAFIIAALAAGIFIAALVRMFANIGQHAFEAENILHYQYKEHTVYLNSLLSGLADLHKEMIAIRNDNAHMREDNSRASEATHGYLLECLGELNKISVNILATQEKAIQTVNILSAQMQSCSGETHAALKEISANLLFAQEKVIQSVNTLSAQVRLLSEETQVIRSSSEQLACDTRDISGFFSQIEKHLGMKSQP